MVFLSAMKNLKTAMAALALVVFSLATMPSAFAHTDGASPEQNCVEHMQDMMVQTGHDCCDEDRGDPCPDDMNCALVCTTTFAMVAVLADAQLSQMTVKTSRQTKVNQKRTGRFTRLDAPPPRS